MATRTRGAPPKVPCRRVQQWPGSGREDGWEHSMVRCACVVPDVIAVSSVGIVGEVGGRMDQSSRGSQPEC